MKYAWNLFNAEKAVTMLRPPPDVDIDGLDKNAL